MSNKHGVIGVFAILLFTVILTIYQNTETKSQEGEYFKNVNFSFKGEVYFVDKYRLGSKFYREQQPSAGPKFDANYLKKIYSTIDEYDPSDSTLNFYCLIKPNEVFVVERSNHKNIEGNDIIEFNGEVDSTYHYKVICRRVNGEIRNDTILFSKWKPSHIFSTGNRESVMRDLLEDVSNNTPLDGLDF